MPGVATPRSPVAMRGVRSLVALEGRDARRREQVRRWRVPWPIASVLAGAAGTATMTLAYAAERRLRSVGRPLPAERPPPPAGRPSRAGRRRPLDYDDSLVPGRIVASVLHLPSVTAREEAELGTLLRWGYGSAFGVAHGALRHALREPRASVVFGAALMTATLSLFPLLGRTPPPWRWGADVLATSFGTHAAYVTAVALVGAALGGRS
jgi:hypothetical protein